MWLGLFYFIIIFFLYFYIILIYFKIMNRSLFKNLINLSLFFKLFLNLISILFVIFINIIYLSFNNNTSFSSLIIIKSLNNLSIYIFPFMFIFMFITFLSILFCLSYNINETYLFIFYVLFILFIGLNLFFTDYLIYFFFFYEMLLIPSFLILYKFAKTRRAVEASYLMFFWTQFGAIFLIFIFFYIFFLTNSVKFSEITLFTFSNFDINFILFFLILGFGVKLPIWPFYGWLPKAHVEASTNFSIFLSGVLVKFAFFGLLKCILIISLESSFIGVIPLLIIGILDSSFKLFYQIDLKKIVAYSTVIEMHWLTLSLLTGYSYLFLAGFCMLVSHAFLSTNFFFLVDMISRRYKTRLITEINSVSLFNTNLFILLLINLLIFLGFPGSLFFIAEVLFFAFLLDFLPVLVPILIIMLYLLVPSIFFKNWWAITGGNSELLKKKYALDLNKKEFILVFSSSTILFWLGLTWQIFLF